MKFKINTISISIRSKINKCKTICASKKKTGVKKEVLIKGKQENLNDVIAFIANIVLFARFFVKKSKEETEDQPYIIQLIIEIADFYLQQNICLFTKSSKRVQHYASHTYYLHL